MTTGALGYVLTGAHVLLAKQTQAKPERWNGVGGVPTIGENMASMLRRIFQTIGLTADVGQPLGEILYHHPAHGTWRVMAYRIDTATGTATSSPVMEVAWYPVTEIPYAGMWPGDELWVPYIVDGKKFQAEIWFDERDRIRQHDVSEMK